MTKVTITRRARQDLAGTWRYTRTEWSQEQADSYIRRIDIDLARLGAKPDAGRPCNDIDRPGYFRLPTGSHVLFYRFVDSGVEIVRVLHRSMDYGRHL